MDASTLKPASTPRIAARTPTTKDMCVREVIALALTDLTRSKITIAPDMAISRIEMAVAFSMAEFNGIIDIAQIIAAIAPTTTSIVIKGFTVVFALSSLLAAAIMAAQAPITNVMEMAAAKAFSGSRKLIPITNAPSTPIMIVMTIKLPLISLAPFKE